MQKSVARTNLATLVADLEARSKDIAIVSTRGVRQTTTTYRQLSTLARRFAAELESRNIRKGERIAIWGDNCAEWTAAFFGCVLRGVLPVPLDSAGTLEFARRVVDDVKPSFVVGDAAKIQLLSNAGLAFQVFDTAVTRRTAGAIDELSANDPLQIVFTSGTTGQPKGIVHTHSNVLASLEPIEREIKKYLKYERPFHPIRILHTLPLSHVFGQFMGLWTPPLLGAEVHYESRLVGRQLVQKIKRDRISVLAAVPRVLDLMQAYTLEQFPMLEAHLQRAAGMKVWERWWHFRDVHFALGMKFWAFICGGASLSPVSEQFWRNLGFVVVQGYGMTETTALVSLNHPFHSASGTIGQVLPGREVKLSNEGEVLVRGNTIATTIWQAGAVRQQESEWLHTGDLAEFDDQGNLKFRGRKKDVIVTAAGMNIYPEDLEAALNQQAGVKAAVVLQAETLNGPEPVAVVVITPGTSIESVIQAVNSMLADYQQIRRWHVWPNPDLPRTSTGKILKREIILETAPTNHDHLNLDSLGRVELQAQVEQQYGVSLSDQDLDGVRTHDELNQLINRGSSREPVPSLHRYWKWPWNPLIQVVRRLFIELIALPILRLLAKPRIGNQPSTWPQGPALLVCNHVTAYDAPFVLFALPKKIRQRVAIAMSGEMLLDYRRGKAHFLSPIAYWLITALFNVFPLPRSAGFRESFKHAGEAVNRGYSVLVFPEGRRTDDGQLQSFRAGSGLLWKELGIPAIPVRIDGLGDLKSSPQHRWFRTGTISVSAGAYLPVDPAASSEELTERMRAAVLSA